MNASITLALTAAKTGKAAKPYDDFTRVVKSSSVVKRNMTRPCARNRELTQNHTADVTSSLGVATRTEIIGIEMDGGQGMGTETTVIGIGVIETEVIGTTIGMAEDMVTTTGRLTTEGAMAAVVEGTTTTGIPDRDTTERCEVGDGVVA